MKLLYVRKNLLCILTMLAILFSFSGIGYTATGGVQVELTSPGVHQVYQPGDVVEISGTAQKVPEVSLAVRSPRDGLLFTAQPKVVNGVFTTGFTLESDAVEGKYTISVSALGLPQPKTSSFTVSEAGGAVVELTKPSAGTEFKAGDIVEIAGTAPKVDTVAICVRNSKGGRVYVAQPSVADGSFTTRFTLSDNAVAGEYSIAVTAAGLAGAQIYHFAVTSTGGPGELDPKDPEKPDAILFIQGDGVAREVSYTRAELEAMNQERKVLSATSDFPEDLIVAVEGVPLRTLLEEAGISWGSAQKIAFVGSDGYTAEFTISEFFNQPRYIFPSQTQVEPIIALKRVERSSDYSDMSEQDTPVMCYGQRASTEQTLLWFVKRLKYINVTTDSPDTWPNPEARIITPDSSQKVATQGGEVPAGSEVYLHCSEPIPRIYYTTDGSTPDLYSKIFNEAGCGPNLGKDPPIVINTNTTIKAMSVGRGKWDSNVSSFTFTVIGAAPPSGGGAPGQQVDEKNIEKEELTLESGRKVEKITLLESVEEDIEKGEQGGRLFVTSTGDVDEVIAEIPAAVLQKAREKSMSLGINSRIGNYTLPLEALNLEEIAAGLGVKIEDLSLNIVISKAAEDVKNKLSSKVQAGQKMLVDPVEFRIEIIAPDGKKIEYKLSGSAYVEHDIQIPGDANINQATGVVWNEGKGRFLPLPTRFETRNEQNRAVILSRTNSWYTVLQSSKTFSDIQNHWAQGDIELLAAKMLISGKTNTTYEPNSNITRAEFATLLVKALGLEEGVLKEGQFKDVSSTAWYAGSVATATQENIIKGYGDNLFKPNENITRQEMAVMVARAASVAGKAGTLSDSEQEQELARFKDSAAISPWAAKDAALIASAGIIKGMPGGEFAPQANADRAQSAVILKQFLNYVNYITTQ